MGERGVKWKGVEQPINLIGFEINSRKLVFDHRGTTFSGMSLIILFLEKNLLHG